MARIKPNDTIPSGTWNKKNGISSGSVGSSSMNSASSSIPSTNNNTQLQTPAGGIEFMQNRISVVNDKSKTVTSKYVREFHPLSYLFTVVRGNLEDDCHENGTPRLPSALPGVLNRLMCQEYQAKITKLKREIDDIQKRIDGIHDTVNSLNKERPDTNNTNQNNNSSGRNFGNEIYLLVRNVGMWTRRMETKEQLIQKIKWSIYVLEALQEIDETCNATMFWSYAAWRRLQYKIGPGGTDTEWNAAIPYSERKYDLVESDTPELLRLLRQYEQAYRKNIEYTKLVKDNLGRSSSDEKLSRYIQDNYVHCRGCKALFSKRYDDLFGTRIECPLKKSPNHSKRGSGEEDPSHQFVVRFFCTDCIDAFNPSIIKKLKRDRERRVERNLEELIEEHKLEQEELLKIKSNKKRKKKKKKKAKKNTTTTTNMSTAMDDDVDAAMSTNISYEGSQKSSDDDDDDNHDEGNHDSNRNLSGSPQLTPPDMVMDTALNDDSKINDIWVDFLCRTGSIIELNAFMDEKLGVKVDL